MEGRFVGGVGLDILVGAYADAGNALALLVGGRARAGLVVVVHDVHRHAFATVAAVRAVVVDDVIAHVHPLVELGGGARTQSWRAAGMVGNEVVVERGTAAAPVAAVAVSTLGVATVDQALGHETPLHGGILVAENGETLIDGPRDRAVVDDPVLLVEAAETVPAVGTVLQYVLVAETEAHIAHNDVVAIDVAGVVGHADTVAGSRLSGDGGVRGDAERRLQMDGSRDIEDDGLGSLLLQAPA